METMVQITDVPQMADRHFAIEYEAERRRQQVRRINNLTSVTRSPWPPMAITCHRPPSINAGKAAVSVSAVCYEWLLLSEPFSSCGGCVVV